MRFSVIFNRDLVPEQRDPWIPLDWPMQLVALKPFEQSPAGVAELTLDDVNKITQGLQLEYEDLQSKKQDYYSTRLLRIVSLLAFEFRNYDHSKIDFTTHLRAGISLEKRDVIMQKNGRPTKVIYYYNNEKYAEVVWEFEVDALNFITRRIRRLGYYCIDDVVRDYYVIEDTRFDGNNTYQHLKRLEERTQARQWIIDSLRADVDRFLSIAASVNPASANALGAMVNAFWIEYNPHLAAFINSGGTFLRTKFLNDATYPFLNSLVAPSVTVRHYIVDKLTY